jgi:hypothetical protein
MKFGFWQAWTVQMAVMIPHAMWPPTEPVIQAIVIVAGVMGVTALYCIAKDEG